VQALAAGNLDAAPVTEAERALLEFTELVNERAYDVTDEDVEALRRWRGRTIRRLEALFPSYLFVRMTLEPETWHTVNWTPGVKRIVGTDEVPVPVPDEAIDLIKARCQAGDVVPWASNLRPGSHVRIKDGPLAGLEGVLERVAPRSERVRVLLSLLQTPARVEIEIVDLEEVSP